MFTKILLLKKSLNCALDCIRSKMSCGCAEKRSSKYFSFNNSNTIQNLCNLYFYWALKYLFL